MFCNFFMTFYLWKLMYMYQCSGSECFWASRSVSQRYGSRFIPKCHGSPTLLLKRKYFFHLIALKQMLTRGGAWIIILWPDFLLFIYGIFTCRRARRAAPACTSMSSSRKIAGESFCCIFTPCPYVCGGMRLGLKRKIYVFAKTTWRK